MKGFKQKELRDAARIREMEKQEKELSEKVAQQAEKENGLYVKISSLMDELKKAKEEFSALKTTMLEKEDKVICVFDARPSGIIRFLVVTAPLLLFVFL